MEWWMSRRQLPSRLRERVRQYERQRWAAMRGEDEMDIVKDLPEGLRRDVKRHLCLDLIRKVSLMIFGLVNKTKSLDGSEQSAVHISRDANVFGNKASYLSNTNRTQLWIT